MNNNLSKYATYLIYILIILLLASIFYTLFNLFLSSFNTVPNNSLKV